MKKTTVAINSLLIVVLIAGLGVGYRIINPPQKEVAATYDSVSKVDVTKTVSASGKVEAINEVGLNFASSGRISELKVKVGDRVNEGSLLARIDDLSAKSNVAQAKATLAQANQNLLSAQNSLTNTSNPKTSLDLAYQEKQISAQKLNLQQARSNFDQFKASMADSSKSYQSNVDMYELKYDQAKVTYYNYLDANSSKGYSYSYCVSRTAENGTCEKLLNYYYSLAQASKSLDDAKLSQQQNLVKDQNTLQSYQNTIDSAQANLDSLLAQINQNNQPNSAGSVDVAKSQVTQAEENVESSKVALENAQAQLENTKLIAPISGFVVAVASSVGENPSSVSIGTNGKSGFIIIATTKSLQIRAQFAEADVVNIKAGQDAKITFDAISGLTLSGRVSSVNSINNSNSSGSVVTYDVLISAKEFPNEVKAGMTSKTVITTAQRSQVLGLPSSDVSSTPLGYFVKVKSNDKDAKSKQVKVQVGLKGDSYIEITSGLAEGDQVEKPASGSNSLFPSGGIPGGIPSGITGGLGSGLGK